MKEKNWKQHINFKNAFYAAIITLAAQGIYKNVTGFVVDAYRTVKNTPAQDECIKRIDNKLDIVIETLETGVVKKNYFTHHVKRDSVKYAEIENRLVKIEHGRYQR